MSEAPTPTPPAPAAPSPKIPFDDFKKLQLRTAKVLQVTEHPKADRLYVMQIDLGDEKRQIVAGLRGRVPREKLEGSTIIVVANLAPVVLRGVESNGMLLAANDAGEAGRVVVLTTADPVAPGSVIS